MDSDWEKMEQHCRQYTSLVPWVTPPPPTQERTVIPDGFELN
jgi:hypothetical protein